MNSKFVSYAFLASLTLALPLPLSAQLNIEVEYLVQNRFTISWPSSLGTAVQETVNLSNPDSWKPIEQTPVLADGRFSFTQRQEDGEKYFRLQLASGDFSEPILYPSSNGARLFAVGDYNGDTHLDVITISDSQKTLAVLLGDGTGALGGFKQKNIGLAPVNVVAADLNKDGKDDLVMGSIQANDEYGVSVFLAGGEDFAEPIELKVTSEFPQEYITLIEDFNEDGNADIVAWGATKTVMFLGNGAGAFPNVNVVLEPGLAGLSRVLSGMKLADVNDDGHVDLASGLFGKRSVTAVLGDGKGGLTERPESAFGGVTNTLVGVLGTGNFVPDPDGKSFDDLVIFADDEKKVAIVKSVGDGTFMEGEMFDVHESENTNRGVTGASGDLNGDGFTDFVISSAELLPGNQFALHLDLFYNNQQGSFVRRDPIEIAEFGIDEMEIIDLNKDGKNDIIGTARNDVVVLLGISGN